MSYIINIFGIVLQKDTSELCCYNNNNNSKNNNNNNGLRSAVLRLIIVTSQHLASLGVVLPCWRTPGCAMHSRAWSHATPSDNAAVGGSLCAKRTDIPILIDR